MAGHAVCIHFPGDQLCGLICSDPVASTDYRWPYRAGLPASAAGGTIAAFGVADPIIATKDQLTAHGNMHGLGATLGIPSLPIAAVLISLTMIAIVNYRA